MLHASAVFLFLGILIAVFMVGAVGDAIIMLVLLATAAPLVIAIKAIILPPFGVLNPQP